MCPWSDFSLSTNVFLVQNLFNDVIDIVGYLQHKRGEIMIDRGAFQRRSRIALAVAASLTAPALGWGDEPAGPASAGNTAGLEEITVTARKTSEALQTTPVAVTAINAASLVQQQVFQVNDLQHASPDLSIGGAGTGPSSIVYLAIRGEAQNSPNSASDNAVGIYVDGVYIARPIIGNLGFLDVSQVEVLRGPQGTLFGRNTTGGALNITTNQPTNTLEGYVKAGFGNYSAKLGEAVANLPILADTLNSRFAFRYDDHHSYYTNPVYPQFSPTNLANDYQGRAQVKWTPNSVPLVIDWSYDFAKQSDSGTPTALTGFNATSNVAGPIPLGGLLALAGVNPSNYLVDPTRSSNPNYRHSFGGVLTNMYNPDAELNKPFNKNRAEGIAQNLDLDVGPVHVKSISAYRWSDTSNAESLAGMPINYYAFVSKYIEHQASEELQFSGHIDKFDVIGGVYYLQEGGTERSDAQAFGFLSPVFASLGVPLPPQPVTRNLSSFDARSIAMFGQTNYHITDTIRATAGYRYTWDSRDLTQHGRADLYGANVCSVGVTANTALAAPGFPCSNPFSAAFSYPAWTASLDWQATDDTFLYLKTSRASMAGGFNTRPTPPTVSPAFAPESNTDVEFGVKNEMFEHRLRTNLAVFAAWQKNVQRILNTVVEVAGKPTVTQYVTNAGKTRTHGVELELTAVPWTGMEVSATGAYLHAQYSKGTFTELQQLPNGTIVTVDRSGETVPQAPKFTASIGATQTIPLAPGKLSLHVDYSWRDKLVYTSDTASPLQPAAVQAQYATQNALGIIPSYGLFNARLAFNLDKPDLELALYGRNLANKEYYIQQFDSYASLGVAENFQGDPRTYGATVTYKF
jgi:iron complex outermembrane receptor protein